MGVVDLVMRLALAGLFMVAGVAKLADPAGTRRAVSGFGVPASLVGPVSVLLPVVELGVAAVLLPADSARWGGLGAIGLLLVLSLAVGWNLTRGRRPQCHCFGQLHSAPLNWRVLVRNGLLAAVAAWIVWLPPSARGGVLAGVSGWTVVGTAAGLLVVLVIAVQTWFLLHLLRQHGRLLTRIEALETASPAGSQSSPMRAVAQAGGPAGLPVGSVAPDFTLPDLDGRVTSLSGLRSQGRSVLLLFLDPGCGPCTALLPEVAAWERQLTGRLTLAVVSRGTARQNAVGPEGPGPQHLQQRDREVAASYQVHGTPGAVLVGSDGRIASPVASGADAIRALVRSAVDPSMPAAMDETSSVPAAVPRPSRVGESVPALRLPALDGGELDLAELRGDTTLLLFWNPACGFCQQMLPALQEWPQGRVADDGPSLVVISRGSPDEQGGLRRHSARVLLDGAGAAIATFGAPGTPAGVLIDPDGRIASAIAVGATEVLALAASTTIAPPDLVDSSR